MSPKIDAPYLWIRPLGLVPLNLTYRLLYIDHHGPSIHSGLYTASINCCKKTLYCNDHTITEFVITDKKSSTAYELIDTWCLDSNGGGSLITPMALAHPLHPIGNRSRNKRRNLWINHLPPACLSTFWKSIFKQQLGCRFDIMDNISYFLCFVICNYICIDTSDHFSVLPS